MKTVKVKIPQEQYEALKLITENDQRTVPSIFRCCAQQLVDGKLHLNKSKITIFKD
jgi:hypothetical protein